MGSYSPGEPASSDNEATRPLRAGAPAQDGAVRSPGNPFVRLRAAWKSMRNPEASPEELGYVPHLRSRLIAILVVAHYWPVYLRDPAELPLPAGAKRPQRN